MAKQKLDGVVEAAHYQPDGQLAWVRAYVRRGPTYSDHLKLDRAALIEQIKSGKHYFAGKRLPLLGSTFEVSNPLKVLQKDGRDVLVTGDLQAGVRDRLDGIPLV